MPESEPRPKPDQPESTPTPNQPKDPSVYGGQWGREGDQAPGRPPPDRPDRIEVPPGSR